MLWRQFLVQIRESDAGLCIVTIAWGNWRKIPLYSPPHPSSRTTLFRLPMILSRGPSFFATCIRLLMVMYGYVRTVAINFPMAPRTKISLGRTLPRRFSRASFNCSNMVYCRIGFMTSTRAGSTPAKRAVGPSSRNKARSVLTVDSLRVF